MLKQVSIIGTFNPKVAPLAAWEAAQREKAWHAQQMKELDSLLDDGYTVVSSTCVPSDTGSHIVILLYKPNGYELTALGLDALARISSPEPADDPYTTDWLTEARPGRELSVSDENQIMREVQEYRSNGNGNVES